uniref:Reverse transcriptase n=1 Tax=Solanum tuberosum TaxID=4113 RepID=M1DG87_SOLTU
MLMIQVQIQGSPQDRDVIQAILHSQIVWRVQNHAMSLPLPSGENVLLLNVDAINGTTICNEIPRKLAREELVKILPDSWVTNYKKLRRLNEPPQSFVQKQNKTVSTSFDHSYVTKTIKTTIDFQMYHPSSMSHIPKNSKVFSSNFSDIKIQQDWIKEFDNEGRNILWFKCPFTGHCPWDIECSNQEEGIEWDEHHHGKETKPKKMEKREISQTYENGDSSIGLLCRPGKNEFLVSYKPKNWPALPSPNKYRK